MLVDSFAVKIDQDKALQMVKKRMSLFGKLLVGKNSETEMKTIFIENKIITYKINHEAPFFVKWFKKDPKIKSNKVRMIANGSTAGVSLYDDTGVNIVEMDVDEDQLQRSDYPDNQLEIRGNALARKILRRRVGGHVTLETLEIKSVYRPYHVVFFGKLVEGQKVRYMPVPADENMVRKTF